MKDSGENMGKYHCNSLKQRLKRETKFAMYSGSRVNVHSMQKGASRQQEEKQLTLNPRVAE